MENVILGTKGKEIIESEKFNTQFKQLALYSNKYYNHDQFFLIFNCPSIEKIETHNKLNYLGEVIANITKKLPYTFKLQCKFESESELENNPEIKQEIIKHFKILFEVPNYKIEDESSDLYDIFIELQKAQLQAENQLLWNIDKDKFSQLWWGYESNEHVYLKYFAINTLSNSNYLYPLNSIICERFKSNKDLEEGFEIEDFNSTRIDVYAEDKIRGSIFVEVETLRGKNHIALLGDIRNKAYAWSKDKLIKEMWLVVPGFEIARNYYQLNKIQEILTSELQKLFNKKIVVKILLPDFITQELIDVDMSKVYLPSYKISTSVKSLKNEKSNIKPKTGFINVIGLNEEKEILLKLKKLEEEKYNIGLSGILFFGLPGCGKTYIAKAFAEEVHREFLSFSSADIASGLIGIAQQKIKEIFNQAKSKSPSILLIDELDSIAFSRNTTDTVHTDQKATINQLLLELNNAEESNVLVIGATNFPSRLDDAIKRSGRFDLKIPIFPPSLNERAEMFKYYIDKVSSELNSFSFGLNDSEFIDLGKISSRFTSSDIKTLCNKLRIDIILEKSKSLNLDKITSEIELFKSSGQLSLNTEQVQQFISDCKIYGVNSYKIEELKRDWNITEKTIGFSN